MGDESPLCKLCGAELQGRDVYEGTCKNCREEAILGAPAPIPPMRVPRQHQAPPHAPPMPQPQGVPPQAIAIETAAVDLDADTREIPGEDEPATPGSPATGPDADLVLPPLGLADDGGEPHPSAAPTSAEPPAPMPAPQGHDLPTVALDALPPPQAQTTAQSLAQGPAPSPASSDAEPLAFAPHDEAHPAPQPRLERPTPPPKEPHRPFSLTREKGQRPAPKPDTSESSAEFATLEEDPRDRPTPSPIQQPEPRGGEPAPASPAPAPRPLSLETDTSAGHLRALLDEMGGQVEQLCKVLSRAHQVAPSAFWFGFRAFFGFVLGMGVLAAVVVGLTALIGALFYPPALELLRQIFTGLSGR